MKTIVCRKMLLEKNCMIIKEKIVVLEKFSPLQKKDAFSSLPKPLLS